MGGGQKATHLESKVGGSVFKTRSFDSVKLAAIKINCTKVLGVQIEPGSLQSMWDVHLSAPLLICLLPTDRPAIAMSALRT